MVNVPLAGEKPGSDSLPRCLASVRHQDLVIDLGNPRFAYALLTFLRPAQASA